MPRMPGAQWVGEQSPRNPMDRYDIVCVHTIVGYAPAHAAHFSVKADGTILQSRDTAYQSGANLYGNPRVIAIENEDHGDAFPDWSGSNVPALTDAQVEANAKILKWAHEAHGIPLQLCPNSKPESQGLAYHRQGIDGNFPADHPGRVAGGEVWTLSPGKVCPGDRRIDQLPDILELAQGDPMADYEKNLERIERKVDRVNAILTKDREWTRKFRESVAAAFDADKARDDAEAARDRRIRDRILAELNDDPADPAA